MFNTPYILATTDTIFIRLGVCVLCSISGVILILTGLGNIRTQTADAGGARAWGSKNLVAGQNYRYTGSRAVRLGRLRIFCGIGAIIFGVVFIFVGPFLAGS